VWACRLCGGDRRGWSIDAEKARTRNQGAIWDGPHRPRPAHRRETPVAAIAHAISKPTTDRVRWLFVSSTALGGITPWAFAICRRIVHHGPRRRISRDCEGAAPYATNPKSHCMRRNRVPGLRRGAARACCAARDGRGACGDTAPEQARKAPPSAGSNCLPRGSTVPTDRATGVSGARPGP
jgi:hypothetical protein